MYEAQAQEEIERLDTAVEALLQARELAERRLRGLWVRRRVAKLMESVGLPPLPFAFVAGAIGGAVVAVPAALAGLPAVVWGAAALVAAGAAGAVWWRWFFASAVELECQAAELGHEIDGMIALQSANRARRAVLVSDSAIAARKAADALKDSAASG
ncbi:MAG: hypothetical protein AB8G96_09055 [Phycisphaerales bacterium]